MGSYEENTFNFKNGLNIIVGDNNSGKSKLHNAIRYIISDEILLEYDDVIDPYEIDDDTINDVVNQSVLRSLKNNDKTTVGVKLCFSSTRQGEERIFILTKEVICKLDIDVLKIVDQKSHIHSVDPHTKSPKRYDADFQEIANRIISPKFMNYFFIEGEQLGLMTPLEGDKLKDTINSIVQIQTIDQIEEYAKWFESNIFKKKSEIELTDKSLSKKRKDEIELAIVLKQENKELEKSIDDFTGIAQTNKELIDKYRRNAEESRKNKELLDKLNQLQIEQSVLDDKFNNARNKYVGQLLSESVFALSKLNDDSNIEILINNLIGDVKSFIAERRTELDSKLTKKEQKMITALEKSQPKPDILDMMIKDHTCYVCSSELNESAIKYMKEKLIPFFRDELEDDEELNNLLLINEFFLNLNLSSRAFYSKNEIYFKNLEDEIIGIATEKLSKDQEIIDFIGKYGTVQNADQVSITTYDKAVTLYKEANEQIRKLSITYKENLEKINTLDKNPKKEEHDSEDLKNAKNLHDFSVKFTSVLSSIKKDEYVRFASMLEEKSTSRFQSFMKNNIVAKNLKINVVLEQDYKGDYNFKINVVNQYGEIQDNPGGADQALRRVAVVFGLLDLAENKTGFPFIADAPISKLSPDTKTEFFKSLLKDPVLQQSIILTMDLWSSQKQNLDKIGSDVLKLIEDIPQSSMITIVPKPGNKGVVINYLKK